MTDAALPATRAMVWPTILGATSVAYGLIVILHSIARFAFAAFGPIIPGVGGDRIPVPPVELRWEIALEAVFLASLGVLLLCAASALLQRRRHGVLLLGFWSLASIAVSLVFLAWAATLADEREAYHRLAELWRAQAERSRLGNAQPFGRYEVFLDWIEHMTNAVMAIPFIYPAVVGLIVLLPGVRRATSEWK